MEQPSSTVYPGVFRPLLHKVDIYSRELVVRGKVYRWSLCGAMCLANPAAPGSLMLAYMPGEGCAGVSAGGPIAFVG